MHRNYIITILVVLFAFAKAYSQLHINEIDSDTPGTDTAEFVEIKSATPQFSLDGYVLVFFNGSSSNTSGNGRSYLAIDLDGYTTDLNGLFVVGGRDVAPVPDLLLNENIIQNGADAVAIYQGNDTDWPIRTLATTTQLIDAVAYDTNDSDSISMMQALGITIQYNEGNNGSTASNSLQRKADGTYEAKPPTPHDLNDGGGISYISLDYQLSNANLNEGDQFTLTFNLSSTLSSDLTIPFSLSNNTFDTSDYTAPTTATIPNGQTSTTIAISIIDDTIDEGDEIMYINIDNNFTQGIKRMRDEQEVIVYDNDFVVAAYGTPLNPTYNMVSSDAPAGYYDSLNNLSGTHLKNEITAIIAQDGVVRIHSYNDATEILKKADASPLNSNNVWLLYTEQERSNILFQNSSSNLGKWNREHIYSRSRGGFQANSYDSTSDGLQGWLNSNADSLRHGQSDAHHLRATDGPENSARGNKDYPEYNGPSNSQGSWHGDVARALFYMAVRYNGLDLVNGNPSNSTVGQLGDLATLLQWHRNDPPDDFEMNRNNVVYQWQNNRNPFIDLPELAEYIWGNQAGQNFTLAQEDIDPVEFRVYPNPSDEGVVTIAGINDHASVIIFDVTGRIQGSYHLTPAQPQIRHQLPAGMYVLHVKEHHKLQSFKLIVN
jgi:endonuclease I